MEEKRGFFDRLKQGLSKTRTNIASGFDSLFSGHTNLDEDFFEELEEILIMGDVGVRTTEQIIDSLKKDVKEEHIKEPAACKERLIEKLKEQMQPGKDAFHFLEERSVVMVIGVNGVGKTTTIGKIASILKRDHKKVLIAAADTFRAAAGEQLEEWSKRVGVDIIEGKEGADPTSVLFDAVKAASARHADVLLCDTAGRLHNKKNLMNELNKMDRIIERELVDAKRENLLVLDATTGQNALVQAKEFRDAVPISGIVLTKMDGTAKGGIAIAIQSELHIPVKFIGVGEQVEDLMPFEADRFIDALFSDYEEEKETC